MKMKKILVCILAVIALLVSGCGKQEPAVVETEPDREIDIWLDAYMGVISVLEKDMDGNQVPCEYGAMSVLGAAGEPIANAFTSSGFSDITPVLEGDTFEGWMECRYDDELGSYVIVSQTLYSTQELMAMPVPEAPVEYFAKWASIPMEEYFVSDIDDAIEDASTSGVFAFTANGGIMRFHRYDNEEYESDTYGYGLDYGQALNDIMGTEYADALISISKEGAEFTGWTLYMADDIFFGTEIPEEEDILVLFYMENDYYGVLYALLRNATLVGENMPTEQLCGMTCYGENYLAVASWSDDAPAEAAPAGGTFDFCGNGGSIHFMNRENNEYKTIAYSYYLKYGQALNDVMGTEYGDAIIDVTKDGAEFIGWTLYQADAISWSYDEVFDTQILCLPYNDSTGEYILLEHAVLLGELMSTEQLCGMTITDGNYVAMANWKK